MAKPFASSVDGVYALQAEAIILSDATPGKYYDKTGIVEIAASVTLFGYLNRWNNSSATDLEDYPKQIAEKLIGNVGWGPGKHEG